MALKKTINNTTKKVTIYGSGTLIAFLALLMGLGYYGISIEGSGDQVCGDTCISYFNITITNYSLAFAKDFNLYISPNVDTEVYKADVRYSVDNPNRWKPYNFSGKTLTTGKSEFKIIAHKDPSQTVKWGVFTFGEDLDPYWYGLGNDMNVTLISPINNSNVIMPQTFEAKVTSNSSLYVLNTTLYIWNEASYNQYWNTTGLVAWYQFDSNDARDYLGLNNGTNYGAYQSTVGKIGGSSVFDGVNDYVNVSKVIPLINGSTTYTISLWEKGTTSLGHLFIGDNCVG